MPNAISEGEMLSLSIMRFQRDKRVIRERNAVVKKSTVQYLASYCARSLKRFRGIPQHIIYWLFQYLINYNLIQLSAILCQINHEYLSNFISNKYCKRHFVDQHCSMFSSFFSSTFSRTYLEREKSVVGEKQVHPIIWLAHDPNLFWNWPLIDLSVVRGTDQERERERERGGQR